MADLPTMNLTMVKGKSFMRTIYWGLEPLQFRTVTGVSKTAPVTLTVPNHGLPASWPIAITDVAGMSEINAKAKVPLPDEYLIASRVDQDTLTIPNLSAVGFSNYTSGGLIRFATPANLTGCSALFQARRKPGSPVLLEMSTVEGGGVFLDVENSRILLYTSPEQTETLGFKVAQYELELRPPPTQYAPAGDVYPIMRGTLAVLDEYAHTLDQL